MCEWIEGWDTPADRRHASIRNMSLHELETLPMPKSPRHDHLAEIVLEAESGSGSQGPIRVTIRLGIRICEDPSEWRRRGRSSLAGVVDGRRKRDSVRLKQARILIQRPVSPALTSPVRRTVLGVRGRPGRSSTSALERTAHHRDASPVGVSARPHGHP